MAGPSSNHRDDSHGPLLPMGLLVTAGTDNSHVSRAAADAAQPARPRPQAVLQPFKVHPQPQNMYSKPTLRHLVSPMSETSSSWKPWHR